MLIAVDFEGKVLKLALEGSCPALDFLKKSDSSSSMPIIHVQDVKRSELICFEWDDNILLHSYHNTEYGKGHEIHYDFGKIESELAGRFLIGKVCMIANLRNSPLFFVVDFFLLPFVIQGMKTYGNL